LLIKNGERPHFLTVNQNNAVYVAQFCAANDSLDFNADLFYFVDHMGKGDYLGEFEMIVLLAILRLGKNAYGVTILEEIQKRTGRPTSIGAVYATLDRFESKGYVSSKMGDPTRARGGRAKRIFSITAKGSAALEASRKILASMWTGLDPILGKL
jgi:PadR family transcriptional regulator, regulatory protein PadR